MSGAIQVTELAKNIYYDKHSKMLFKSINNRLITLATGITLEDAKSLVESMEGEGK